MNGLYNTMLIIDVKLRALCSPFFVGLMESPGKVGISYDYLTMEGKNE